MKRVSLLDCTLRDGGYVNNWEFGHENIERIIRGLENSGIDILELGFLKNVDPNSNRTIFSRIEDINVLLKKKKKVLYSAMIEAFDPYPIEKLIEYKSDGVDLIRVCIWKRCLIEHMEYCKEVSEKGYRISVQPSRVEQYNDAEFIDMIKRSNELKPYSVYVVDTWGTQSSKQIMHYLKLADEYLDEGIKIGYHGHNNKLQAMHCAINAINLCLTHDLCIDSSIMGMGRGAGNLNTELMMDYMNEQFETNYNISTIIDIFNTNMADVYRINPWGYSIYYYLSAQYGVNPNYATYFKERAYGENNFEVFLKTLSEKEKIVFSSQLVDERINEIRK